MLQNGQMWYWYSLIREDNDRRDVAARERLPAARPAIELTLESMARSAEASQTPKSDNGFVRDSL